MKIVVKSVQSGKYRQKNGTWGFCLETAKVFDPNYRHLAYYRENPDYYTVLEIEEIGDL